jgi:hypothetical protein
MREQMNNMTDELKDMVMKKTNQETAERMKNVPMQWQETRRMIASALFPEDEAYMMAA